MRLFESKFIDLRRSAPAKPSKRFVSCFIDMMICCVIALLLFSGASAIAFNTNTYIEAGEIVDKEIDYYINWTEESHIVEYFDKENGVRKDTETMVCQNLLKAIYHSYKVLGNEHQPEFEIDEKVMKFGEASLENDTVAYFYTNYGVETNLIKFKEGQTKQEFLAELYKDAFLENSSMLVFNLERSDMPILSTQVAYSILYYIENGAEDKTGEVGLDYYNAFYDAYAYMLSSAEDIMIRSEPYYSTHYMDYYNALSVQARITNIALIISIFVAYVIGVFVPKLLFKDERTIGRVLMKLGAINDERQPVSMVSIIIRSILEVIGFMFIAFIIYMFPPFNGSYDAMMTPFIGEANLTIILLVIALISLIINVFMLFTHYSQNLINMIFRDRVVDLRRLDYGDRDEEYEGKSI